MDFIKRMIAQMLWRFWKYTTLILLCFKNDIDLYCHLAKNIAIAERNPQKSIKILLRGLKRNPYSRKLKLVMANMHAVNKDFDIALALYRELLNEDKNNPQYNYDYALALMKKGDYKDAINHLYETRDIIEISGDLYFILGNSYMELNDYDNAIKYLNIALEMSPNNKFIIEANKRLRERIAVTGNLGNDQEIQGQIP